MEAIGRLSGAVAHEFNNVLTGVVGLADLPSLAKPFEIEKLPALVREILDRS